GTALGQIRFRKLDAPGNLVTRKASSVESNEVVRSKSFASLQNYASHYKFAPLRIGYAEDGYFTNGRMAVDHCFHLSRINVLTTGNNHVFEPVEDVKISRSVLMADISRMKESFAKRCRGFFRIIPIAAHDVGASGD